MSAILTQALPLAPPPGYRKGRRLPGRTGGSGRQENRSAFSRIFTVDRENERFCRKTVSGWAGKIKNR